jgi:uncharacterized protein involved in response to NO
MSLFRHPIFFAPHRFFFAAGFAQWVFLLVFWTLEMLARVGGNDLPWTGIAPARWLHGTLFVFGPFPLWIFAFAFTAMPRWLRLPPVEPGSWLPGGLAIAAGWLLADLALWSGSLRLLLIGFGTVGAGWGLLLMTLWRIARRAPAGDWHPRLVGLAVSLGVPALWIGVWGLSTMDAGRIGFALSLGVWGFLLPTFLVVAHRMLPFFTRSALPQVPPWQPMWVLWALLAAVSAYGFAAAALPGAAWLPALAGLGLSVTLSLRWQLKAALANRLLATHHLALLWLSVAFALGALQSILHNVDIFWGGHAPLHAATFGFAVSMVFGMATRVTLGHSGNPIGATPLLWKLFWTLQGAVLLRLLAELLPALATALLPLAIVLSVGVFAVWLQQYARYWAIDADE